MRFLFVWVLKGLKKMSYLVFKVSSFLLSLISIVRSDVQMFDKKEIEIYQYSNPSKIGASFSWETIYDDDANRWWW